MSLRDFFLSVGYNRFVFKYFCEARLVLNKVPAFH